MMEAYVTEEQQVEAIKKWFNQYGNMLSWAIFVILAIALAVKYWFHHEKVVAAQTSDVYETLMLGVDQKEEATIQNQADKLIKEEPDSSYATFAAYTLADQALQNLQFDTAEKQLQWAMEQAKQKDLSGLARVRLMRIFISQEKLSEALALYDRQATHAYLPIMEELRGDILLKQQDREGAREAYKKAYELSPKEGMSGVFLKLKLEELGVDPTK
jgi:predicted negative regulator of RcsB-dependent stress response